MITPPYVTPPPAAGGSGTVGPQGPKGDPGTTPTDAQLTALITPLIPPPVKGDKGDPGSNGSTPTNAQLTALITPLIPPPIKGDTGAQGAKGDTGAQGLKGDTGSQGPKGDTGAGLSPGQPVALTVAFGTPQQAPDPTKPALVTVEVQTDYAVTLAGTQVDEVELRVGPASAGLAAGTSGARASSTRQSLTGIAITVGLAQSDRTPLTALIPVGGWFVMRRIAGATTTINAARAVALQ